MENKEEKDFRPARFSWYPGHMAKTKKQIENDVKLVDVVIELLDARAPLSSQNPDIKAIIKNKKRIIILNKSDLADEKENSRWINYFQRSGIPSILCNSKNGQGIEKIELKINQLMEDEKINAINKGRINKTTRVMIVGIPNVGKSSLINRISKKANMEVGNKPGVTKQKQWVRLTNNIELLDTPGVLWPKLDERGNSLYLAYTGTIKAEIIEETEIAYELTKLLVENYKENLISFYKLSEDEVDSILNDEGKQNNERIVAIMEIIGKIRGALIKGGNIDLDRTAKIILDDFKNGRMGRITLEKVP